MNTKYSRQVVNAAAILFLIFHWKIAFIFIYLGLGLFFTALLYEVEMATLKKFYEQLIRQGYSKQALRYDEQSERKDVLYGQLPCIVIWPAMVPILFLIDKDIRAAILKKAAPLISKFTGGKILKVSIKLEKPDEPNA